VLSFRTQRTARRPPVNSGRALQRKLSWVVMALLMFVVLYGQSAWQQHKKIAVQASDGAMVDNRIDNPTGEKAADAEARTPTDRIIMPGDLKPLPAKPMLADEGKRLFGGASSKWLAVVADDSAYRAAESDPIFSLLQTLRDAKDRDVAEASIGKKTFVQLFEQADDYRGQIVTVGGTVERIIKQTNPAPYPHGIAEQYEVWLKPDGGRLPIVALCLELPAGMSVDSKPAVDVTGFFFKRLGYPSAEKASPDAADRGTTNVFRSSPLVLAKSLRVRPVAAAPTVAAEDEGPAFLTGVKLPIPSKYVLPLLGGGMVLLTAVSAWAYGMMRSPPTPRGPLIGGRRNEEEPAEPTNLNSLDLEP